MPYVQMGFRIVLYISNLFSSDSFDFLPMIQYMRWSVATWVFDWYASDNSLRGTPRGSRKKPNAGRYPTGRLWTDVLCRDLEKNGMVGAWHGHGMASVNQTRPHCVNQMGKTHSKHLAAWARRGGGMGTAWARHGMCESAFKEVRCVHDEWGESKDKPSL